MLKRLFDIIISFSALLILWPILLLTGLLVAINFGPPVLFRQSRPGKNNIIFEMIKFRSMKNALDNHGNPLSDEERITSFGKLIRSLSLDELPGLWNVLKGDMSLVGPRPLLTEYLPLYNSQQARRHEVKPGITGWAQINGRNAISWEDKFTLDVWYVDNQSFWLDIKILCLTVKKVFFREGISAQGEVTMSKFSGSNGKP
ncbi:MAG: sugar transferase [Gammaproteobacteria bacterium CG22_combo_CG10-13_8_21_14_all_40_8]|nr:MAG: sugar transferase [Gammaproteobacteria bacterium CG22_combo_CG10-13_8_21_14_all_40_8]